MSLSGLWQSHRWEACFPFFYISRLWKFASYSPGLSPQLAARGGWGRARTLRQSSTGRVRQSAVRADRPVWSAPVSYFRIPSSGCVPFQFIAFLLSLIRRVIAGRERKWNSTLAKTTRWKVEFVVWHCFVLLHFPVILCFSWGSWSITNSSWEHRPLTGCLYPRGERIMAGGLNHIWGNGLSVFCTFICVIFTKTFMT